jgi:hypothetical protein
MHTYTFFIFVLSVTPCDNSIRQTVLIILVLHMGQLSLREIVINKVIQLVKLGALKHVRL